MKFLRWASILCMLAFRTTYTMKSDLGSYLNVRSFGLKVAKIGLAKDKKITIKDVLKLYKHLNQENVIRLFGIEAETLDQYFVTDKLKGFIKHITDEEPEAQELKASALRKSFKITAWEQALECTNLEPLLKDFIDLYYFTGSLEDKRILIRHVQECLTQLRPADAGQRQLRYEKYLSLPVLRELFQKMYDDTQVSQADILRIFSLQRIMNEVGPTSILQDTVHLGNLIPFTLSLLMAESSEGMPFELLNCLRWDLLVDNLPTLIGCSKEQLEKTIHLPRLKQLIVDLQSGTQLTQKLVRSVVQDTALSFWGIEHNIEDYVDFERLTRGLNELRNGTLHEALTESIKIKELGDRLGIDLEKALDSTQPEEVQKHYLEQLFDLFTHDGLFNKIKEGARTTLAALPLIWLTYHYPYQTAGLCSAAAGLYYSTSNRLPSERSVIVMVNSAALHGSRLIKPLISTDCPVSKLLNQAPNHPEKVDLEKFIRLCQEHLDKLSKPVAIISVFTPHEVFSFISTNEKFIESICSGDPETAHERLMMLYNKLKNAIEPEELPQHVAYDTFMSQLMQSPSCGHIVPTLPHQDLLLIGEYRPQLLMRQPDFLIITSELEGTENITILKHLYAACKLAQELDN